MKIIFIMIFILVSITVCFSQSSLNKYFPLQIGNRWDYHIDATYHGGGHFEDTLSIKIVDTLTIKSYSYYVFSSEIPFLYRSKYLREEGEKIYIYNELDSSDCFVFQFDLPAAASYSNCFDDIILVLGNDTTFSFGNIYVHQYQDSYIFSEHYGIYHANVYGFIEYAYALSGCIISGISYGNLLVGIGEESEYHTAFKLEQNFPNPFNPITTIHYSIPENSYVILKIYDMLGREIYTLVAQEKVAGDYSYTYNGDNLASGIYFYSLQASGFISTKKLVMAK